MPTWNVIQKKRREADARLRALEQRQAEADRQAAAASPPRPAGPPDPTAPSYAEQLAAWNARVKAGEHKTHFTGD